MVKRIKLGEKVTFPTNKVGVVIGYTKKYYLVSMPTGVLRVPKSVTKRIPEQLELS